jgi:hypothetical protein
MSNTQHTDPAAPIRGDFGLGLCLACVKDHVEAARAITAARAKGGPRPLEGLAMPRAPHFAITMAPSPVPVPGPDGAPMGVGLVTLPSCYDHLVSVPAGAPSGRLLVPNGPRP